MGSKFQIQAWKQPAHRNEYDWYTQWQGESFLLAIWHLCKTKRKGFKSVQLKWNG